MPDNSLTELPTRTELIQAALAATGQFNPVPAAGQQWWDRSVTWLPEGHRSVVTITAVYPLVSGWQASVHRRQVDADGATVPSGDGKGVIYLDQLVQGYELINDQDASR